MKNKYWIAFCFGVAAEWLALYDLWGYCLFLSFVGGILAGK